MLMLSRAALVGGYRDGSRRSAVYSGTMQKPRGGTGEAQSQARNKVKVTPLIFASHCTDCNTFTPPPPSLKQTQSFASPHHNTRYVQNLGLRLKFHRSDSPSVFTHTPQPPSTRVAEHRFKRSRVNQNLLSVPGILPSRLCCATTVSELTAS